ncbi:MAG TPA: thiamine-phosphate kinase [Rhizomicrobium sp.]|jgi:thiamine-monophosphate kinase|nr:thiamine-phosphate kinase [Rhizomicrobium sp.]
MTANRAEARGRLGEFELIERIFAPLARGAPGAMDLADDVALLAPRPGCEIVLKTDSLIESVHFRRDDPPSTVGRKALRRALSDLAAKGAAPAAYLLALALPEWPDTRWLEEFAQGLSRDQQEFGISLFGGETNSTPGPVTITVTAVGFVPEDALIRRKGARSGDQVFVTGSIGDAAAGVAILVQEYPPSLDTAAEFLISRYQVPTPRLAFGRAIRGIANAAIDVSDGLLADLGHIADVSGVRIETDSSAIPLSSHLQGLWGTELDARIRAATAGDDYEIAFTAPAEASDAIREVARRTATNVTTIGRVVPGSTVAFLDSTGGEVPLERRGYTHF